MASIWAIWSLEGRDGLLTSFQGATNCGILDLVPFLNPTQEEDAGFTLDHYLLLTGGSIDNKDSIKTLKVSFQSMGDLEYM